MGIKRFKFAGELFLDMFTAGRHREYSVIEDVMPDDAKIVNIAYVVGYPYGEMIEFWIHSKEFPDEPEWLCLCPVLSTVEDDASHWHCPDCGKRFDPLNRKICNEKIKDTDTTKAGK